MTFDEMALYITWTLIGLVSGYLIARFRNKKLVKGEIVYEDFTNTRKSDRFLKRNRKEVD